MSIKEITIDKNVAYSWLRTIGSVLFLVLIVLLAHFLIKTFLLRVFFIPSGSMENTLEVGDKILVNELVPMPFELNRGDVIVFEDTEGWLDKRVSNADKDTNWLQEALIFIEISPDPQKEHLAKRIIGVAGDRVARSNEGGRITVNGEPLDEPYVYSGDNPSDIPFDVIVPEGKIWVMGDHRNASVDSRSHADSPNKGFIDVDDVRGKAFFIGAPLDRMGAVSDYSKVFENVPEKP